MPALLLLSLTLLAHAQTFRTTTQLVVETVTVKGKDGRPVTGLKAADFEITEDGVPQQIRYFEFQKLDTAAPIAPITDTRPASPFALLPRTQILPPANGDTRYRDRRLLAVYFDFTAMPASDQMRAFQAAKQFVKNQMTAADMMALMAFTSGSVQVFQDFTSDRERLLRVLETLIVGEDENAPTDGTDTTKADTGAAFGQNDAEFNIFFTDRQLAALQTAAQMLGRLNEKKSLIYFASGLRLNGSNNQAQLQATINAAIRAGVSLWPVDARGLVASAPMGDAMRGSPGGLAMYTGGAAMDRTRNFQRSQDTLWTLAADTGGKALLDYNDLTRGIVQAQQATESYYILGYYTTNDKPDGKFRRIRISLKNGNQTTLDYRQGYYANKVFSKFTAADKERQLEDALLLEDPVTELTLAMELGYFQLNRAEYFTTLTVKIPGSELALVRKRGADRTTIDFIGEIKDEFGSTISNVRDKVDIKISGTVAAELASRPIEYDTGFTLLPGRYKIKFLARDAVTGRMGTYTMPFLVPNLNREPPQRIPISSVILSSQRVALRDALYEANKPQTQAQHPLVHEGQKLIPSVTRVFRREREMFVFLQAYQPDAATPEPLYAYVSFYRDGAKALETKPLAATEFGATRLRTTTLRFRVPLHDLGPGEYQCQVTVLDPKTRKLNTWQTNILVL